MKLTLIFLSICVLLLLFVLVVVEVGSNSNLIQSKRVQQIESLSAENGNSVFPISFMNTSDPSGNDTLMDVAEEQLTYGYGAVDQRSIDEPASNTLYSCQGETMGVALVRPWVDSNGTINFFDKPIVKGSVVWGSSRLSIEGITNNSELEVVGDGLPNHPTGIFPINRSTEAYEYDRNPNQIEENEFDYSIPAEPQIEDSPRCLPMGPIGNALSGAVFYNPLDADLRDAVANELFDECQGHPDQRGRYHYHHYSSCIPGFGETDENGHSALVGYALDGFGIYGPLDSGGKPITNEELDECHGHFGAAVDGNGTFTEAYHYHANNEFPYMLGCFRGSVNSMLADAPYQSFLIP